VGFGSQQWLGGGVPDVIFTNCPSGAFEEKYSYVVHNEWREVFLKNFIFKWARPPETEKQRAKSGFYSKNTSLQPLSQKWENL